MGGRWGVKRWEAGRMEGGRASTVLPQGELCLLRYTRRRPSPPLRGTMGCRYLNQKSELTGRLFPCRPRNESGRHRRPTARPAALRRRCRLRRRSARRPGEARARGEGRSPTSPPSLPRRAHGPGSRAGGGRRDPRPAGAAPGPLVAAPGRPRAPGEPTGRRGVRGRGAEEEEEEGLCRRVGAPAAPQWHRRPPCRWAESLGGGRRRRRQGRPGAGREPSGAGEAWRGGAGRRRRRGAGVDPAAGPGHGGGAGGRPRRPGGERHVGGVRPAVGRRDGHPGEWGRGGIGLGGSLPWDGAGRGAPLPSTAPPAPPPPVAGGEALAAPAGPPGTCCGVCPSGRAFPPCGLGRPRESGSVGETQCRIVYRRPLSSGLRRKVSWAVSAGETRARRGAPLGSRGWGRGCWPARPGAERTPRLFTRPEALAQADQWAHCFLLLRHAGRCSYIRAKGWCLAAFAFHARVFGVPAPGAGEAPCPPGQGRPARSAARLPVVELLFPTVFWKRVARLRPAEFLRWWSSEEGLILVIHWLQTKEMAPVTRAQGIVFSGHVAYRQDGLDGKQ